MQINVYLEDGAYMPIRAHHTDAGMDLRAREGVTIPPHESAVFDTGVHIGIPEGHCGLLVSKSGLNVKHDILSTGLIDEGYTGSICVKLYNEGPYPFEVEPGDKISQIVFLPVNYGEPKLVSDDSELYESDLTRGNNGFGSTGR
jgi:dUTP pyrophosphatase